MPPHPPLPTSSDNSDCPAAHTRSCSSTQGALLPTEPPVNTGTTQPTTPHTTPRITTPTQTLLETPPETSTPARDITITYEELRRNLQDIINAPSDEMAPTRTHDHPDAMLIKPQEVTKIFDGVEALEGIKNWKMWIFRITNTIETCGMEKLLLDAPSAEERPLSRAIFSSIIKTIPDKILANYIDIREIHLLIAALRKRFDVQTTVTDSVNEGALFKLCTHGKRPADSTYILAITNAIPLQYKYVLGQLEIHAWAINNYQQSLDPDAHLYVTTPNMLINECWQVFANWQTTNKRQNPIAAAHPYRNKVNHPYFRGRGGFRGRGEAELGDADLAAEGETTSWEACETSNASTATSSGILKKAQEQVKPAVNNPGNTLAIAAPAAAAAANIATTSSATIEELPPTPISGSPLTSTMHFANENLLFNFLGEHGADYDINTMEMDHFDVNIQTAGDEGRQMKKKAEAHLQLEYIDAKYDDLDDAAHAALDIKTQEKMSEYGDEPEGRDIIDYVVYTCDRLVQDAESLRKICKKFGKALTTLAKDARKSGSYKIIRNLVALTSAVRRAWTIQYMGTAHKLLHQSIRDMTLHELGKLVFCIPFNLRAEKEEGGFPYPSPDRSIRDHLIKSLRTMLNANPRSRSSETRDSIQITDLQRARLFYIYFLHNLFSAVMEEIKNLPRVNNLQQVAENWSAYLDDDDRSARQRLYEKVVKMPYSGSWSTIYEDSGDAQTEVDLIADRCLQAIQSLISQIDKLANVDGKHGNQSKDVRIVIYVDEAHDLTKEAIKEGPEKERSFYHTFCSATNSLTAAPVFFLYLSTHSNLAEFAPSRLNFPSARVAGGEDNVQPPFTELPFDFDLARSKLTGVTRPDSVFSSGSVQLAVLSIRLLPDFDLTRADSRRTLMNLVQNHMAIAYSIPQHRETLRTGYPSEPILAEAAARQMRVLRFQLGRGNAASHLQSYTESGLIEKGQRGELVARLIMTMAYDEAVDAFNEENGTLFPANSGVHPLYSQGVPLMYYIKALLGNEHAENIFNSRPNNVKDGKPFREAYKDAWVRFTHFQRAGDSSVISSEACWAAAARAMAFQCNSGQALIDILVPVILYKNGTLCEANMSAILVQVKGQRGVVTKASVKIDERDLKFFPPPSDERSDERPYITLVMELGVQFRTAKPSKYTAGHAPDVNRSPSKVMVSKASDRFSERLVSSKKHPRYAITVRGCSPSVYAVVDNKDVFATLLASRHILEEHPRQNAEALSAVRRLKPFWTCGPECFDWTGTTKLSVEQIPDVPAEGVYTGCDADDDVFL
ncbi:hypothetical protein EW145_g3699 [Phellinidium pouzarii]|uniref:Uncharacterized protein n=1 Tax=Phellinidium pouzarii TaxID=167371 RepID=A0A4S4L6E2_9AGAM|nr:hypothetical protein EW145_g3699 [Phellinidium pouzarii]